MAKSERSAGIIVFREDRRVNGGRVFLLLDYGRFWDYPKGHVKKKEDDLAAARREFFEETGIDQIELVAGFRHEIEYFFRDPSKGLIRKTVVFFLGQTRQRQVKLSREHVGSAWLSFDKAVQRVTYANARETLRAANLFLDRRGKRG